jgi:hypothetical protein
VRHIVAEENGELIVRSEPTEDFPEEFRPQSPPAPVRLRPIDEARFATRVLGVNDVVVFMEFERGRPGYLFTGGRASRRKGRSSRRHDGPERPRRPSRDAGRRR